MIQKPFAHIPIVITWYTSKWMNAYTLPGREAEVLRFLENNGQQIGGYINTSDSILQSPHGNEHHAVAIKNIMANRGKDAFLKDVKDIMPNLHITRSYEEALRILEATPAEAFDGFSATARRLRQQAPAKAAPIDDLAQVPILITWSSNEWVNIYTLDGQEGRVLALFEKNGNRLSGYVNESSDMVQGVNGAIYKQISLKNQLANRTKEEFLQEIEYLAPHAQEVSHLKRVTTLLDIARGDLPPEQVAAKRKQKPQYPQRKEKEVYVEYYESTGDDYPVAGPLVFAAGKPLLLGIHTLVLSATRLLGYGEVYLNEAGETRYALATASAPGTANYRDKAKRLEDGREVIGFDSEGHMVFKDEVMDSLVEIPEKSGKGISR